eukprot:6194584-Pleurochrysis_carterae.AAC.3
MVWYGINSSCEDVSLIRGTVSRATMTRRAHRKTPNCRRQARTALSNASSIAAGRAARSASPPRQQSQELRSCSNFLNQAHGEARCFSHPRIGFNGCTRECGSSERWQHISAFEAPAPARDLSSHARYARPESIIDAIMRS